MARLFTTIGLLAAILALAAFEQIWINNVYKTLNKDLDVLAASVELSEKADTQFNIELADKMYEYWLKKERNLAMLIKHVDLAQISDAIIYMRNFIHHDNKEEASYAITRIRYLTDAHSYNLGTSIQNVF